MDLSKTVEVQWAFELDYNAGNSTPCRPTSISERCGGVENLPLDLCVRLKPDYSLCGQPKPRLYLEAIHIQMNFTELFPPDARLLSDPLAEINAAHVYLRLAEKDEFDGAVRPMRLFPGTHLLSMLDHVIRRRLKSRALATLGYEVRYELRPALNVEVNL